MKLFLIIAWSFLLGYSGCTFRQPIEKDQWAEMSVKKKQEAVLPDQVLKKIQGMNAEVVLKSVQALAHDSMEGRGIGMPGYERASRWLEDQFRQNGIQPLFGENYRQPFRVLTASIRSRTHFHYLPPDTLVTWNIGGFIPGKDPRLKQEWIVITAHLDHIGRTQDSIYTGANDNASGVAAMLNAGIFAVGESLRRSVAMIAFSGEESGLLGSRYFTQRPVIPLEDIVLLLNLDLVGSGTQGMMIEGGEQYQLQHYRIKELNRLHFFFTLSTRPNAPNSDHYYFHISGVPALFLYTYNGTCPYHSPRDRPECIDPQVLVNVTRLTAAVIWSFGMAD